MKREEEEGSVCSQEALDLLNCVVHNPNHPENCYSLLNSLRDCVVSKKVKKFSLDYEKAPTAGSSKENA
ncbi:hypothetical protein MLD38_018511 [Melastoma candidum]|uniref:Uncharacterized protein n=1 Tax=Melastoma candidum TaxID=119954 RepID=A0ACB9QX61_9MYRT|nr:hypothetical protein MLD38_018511 [Melastoma candidum]